MSLWIKQHIWALVLVAPLLFLIISLFTLHNYGISWDEPIHFYRGQAYLNYFLTGNTTYEQTRTGSMSYFELNDLSAKYWIEGGDGGHPPLNDILASLSNYIFYQKLRLVGDIDSYHLFNVTAAMLSVITVGVFGYLIMGFWGGVVSSLIHSTYPLFWGESHFNIKDPPETGFISVAIFSFWYSLKKRSARWLILSSIFSGLALGTKFNAFFIPIILLPFLVVKYSPYIKKTRRKIIQNIKKIPKYYILSLVFYPLIVLTIFFVSWPYLWSDPYGNFMKVFHYYKDIGTGSIYQPGYYIAGGFNAYPLYWILVTTPPVALFLSIVGFLTLLLTICKRMGKKEVYVLWLSWLVIPILRVTLPETSIYGGVRQIMEYIPALSLIGGLGFVTIIKKLKLNNVNSTLFLFLIFISHLVVMFNLHPNENVYFNFLVGGLKGAVESKIPYAGNSFGNAYWPLLKWLNQNGEQNARVALVQGTALNIPDIQLRPDIKRWSDYWSGIDRKGEYLIELTHNNYRIAYPYAWDYIERFLEPVATVKVDGIEIAKLWKNDLNHTKVGMQKIEFETTDFKINAVDPDIYITLPKEEVVSHIVFSYKDNDGCPKISGNFYTSLDNKVWFTEPDSVPELQISEKDMIKNGKLVFYLPGRLTKYIRFHSNISNTCLFNTLKPYIYLLR